MAYHGPDGSSDGRQNSDGPSIELSKENILDLGLMVNLKDHQSRNDPSLVPLKGDLGQLHWFRMMAQMTDHWECDSPSLVPSGCPVVEILPDSQGKCCNLPHF
ncbi:hypothetical protein HAX54_053343 [Datura stramonium]|uniref:Uncharacterized protein n=1 Tax=Datura stramonium TaxID=4076 RepID=A0ABS8WPE0_DATST|nr:hypothetical protein [Datura stramonium]